jgi:hypothetical protein
MLQNLVWINCNISNTVLQLHNDVFAMLCVFTLLINIVNMCNIRNTCNMSLG